MRDGKDIFVVRDAEAIFSVRDAKMWLIGKQVQLLLGK